MQDLYTGIIYAAVAFFIFIIILVWFIMVYMKKKKDFDWNDELSQDLSKMESGGNSLIDDLIKAKDLMDNEEDKKKIEEAINNMSARVNESTKIETEDEEEE